MVYVNGPRASMTRITGQLLFYIYLDQYMIPIFYINFLLEYLKVRKDRISFSWFSYSCIFYILVQRRLYKGYRVSAIPKLIFFFFICMIHQNYYLRAAAWRIFNVRVNCVSAYHCTLNSKRQAYKNSHLLYYTSLLYANVEYPGGKTKRKTKTCSLHKECKS